MELSHDICHRCENPQKIRGSPPVAPEKVKLYRIYRRVKVLGKWKFVSIGWTCPKCHDTDYDYMMKEGTDGKAIDTLNMTPEERKQYFTNWNDPNRD